MVDTVTAAFLSKEIYRDIRGLDFIDSDHRFEILSVTPPSETTGYYGAIIEDTTTGEVILVSRGTEISSLDDIGNDLNVGLGWIPTQFSSAESLFETYTGSTPITAAVGHSLGGYISQLIGVAKGLVRLKFIN